MATQQPLDVYGQRSNVIRVCAWHEKGQMYLHMFWRTDSICAICLERVRGDYLKHHKAPKWAVMIQEGGWRQRPSTGYWPHYERSQGNRVQEVYHREPSDSELSGWVCTEYDSKSGVLTWTSDVDDLDEILEAANERI